jgi:hypothetical protein
VYRTFPDFVIVSTFTNSATVESDKSGIPPVGRYAE